MTTSNDTRDALLTLDDLDVHYHVNGRHTPAVSGISFELRRGQTTALLGESGSGKSTIVGSIVGTLPESAKSTGSILYEQKNLLALSERHFRPIRGVDIGYVPQNPARSLDPLLQVGQQLHETLHVHGVRATWEERQSRILNLLERVGFRDPETVAQRYPHELSGGMQQRVLIAIALTWTPQILIADEPTSALDVTVQKTILDLIDQRKAQDHTAVLLVTHDIGVAAERAQQIVVLKHGRIVEAGATQDVLNNPQHDYTKQLLRDVPGTQPGTRPILPHDARPAAIKLVNVNVDYLSRNSPAHRAVNAVSLDVRPGSTLAVVGESGSGKTTTARVIARFLTPSAGDVLVRDASGTLLGNKDDKAYRRHVQFVYQNPYLSLNPKHRVATVLSEPLRNFGIGTSAERAARVAELLDMVALPKAFLTRKPRELSGGQLQRLAIARALAAEPSILVLDEPVSALDVSVQAQILRLLETLQSQLNLTYLFISHDLAVVRQISDDLVVMRDGEIVERGNTEQVFVSPSHPYTRQLIAAVPSLMNGFDTEPALRYAS